MPCEECLKKDKEIKSLKIDVDILESIARSGDQKGPFCDHANRFYFTDDGGKTCFCARCSLEYQKKMLEKSMACLRAFVNGAGDVALAREVVKGYEK